MPTRFAALLPLALLFSGCSMLPGIGGSTPPTDPLSLGLVAMEARGFGAAARHLEAAAACNRAGEGSTEALLLLSLIHLDPRSEARNPTTAARYAARVIRREDITAVDLETARGLYLAARDLGAPPLEGAPVEGEAPAREVDLPALPVVLCPVSDQVAARGLPRHPGPVLAVSVARAQAALDSVSAGPTPTAPGQTPLVVSDVSEEARLRARVQRLEAELARIRKLLRGGG